MNQFLENNLENGLIPVLKRYGIPKTQQCVTLGTNNLTRRINFFINAEMNFPSCRATESVMTTGRNVTLDVLQNYDLTSSCDVQRESSAKSK